jgi:hypothetical protein
MPILKTYAQFGGRHWETGSVHNHWAYQGVKAPHTDEAYSEALLMGISGGAVMGYFSFAYEGYDPQARILTRNTFDPLDTLLSRMGVVQNLRQTSSVKKGRANLLDTLEEGLPAIVWADAFSLPYNNLPQDEGMWVMFPIIVYGYDEEQETVWIADRSRAPLTVSPEALATARSRVKKMKQRVLTLEPPRPEKLAAAVRKGIWDCIKLYTEAPPKGSKSNFGFAAYERWADLLTKPGTRLSWEKEFPAGGKMYAGLTSAFTDIMIFGKEGDAERDVYADFLEEASVILDNGALAEAAQGFRRSAQAWNGLAHALLPDRVPPLGETKELILRRQRSFLDEGSAALEEIQGIDARLSELKVEVAEDFPLDGAEVTAMREELATHVLRIAEIEREAVEALQAAMTGS